MTTDSTCRFYRANGAEIDRDTGRIRREDGVESRLRHKSHRLLLHLIEHRTAPVAKDELVRIVWDGAAVSDDTLVNCVQEIRKALGDDARNPLFIRTMPKTGYWFVAEIKEEELAPPEEPPLIEPAPAERHPRKHWPVIGLAGAAVLAAMLWLFPRPIPTEGEAGWWKIDEGAGAAIHDSVSGAAAGLPDGVAWTSGVSGAALRFGGADLAVSGTPVTLGAPRTLIIWVKTDSNRADATTIFQYGSPALFLHQSGTAGIVSNRVTVIGRTRVDDDRWHQIAGVFEGASRRGRVYVDGVEEANGVLDGAPLESGAESKWSIGRATWGGTPFRGAVDDVRVFPRALRPAEITALHRCGSGAVDLEIPGRGAYYFAPVNGSNVSMGPWLRNTGSDYSGVAFVRRDPGCGWKTTLASDLGQDLTIEAEIKVAGNATDHATEAGPYFRSRSSKPGEGILGGTSAGYWVQLKSTGQVRVRRLYPSSTVAFSEVPPQFDPDRFHKMKAVVRGETLTVSLDDRVLEFDQGGARRSQVRIPADWESASPKGKNHGAAGIAFSAEGNRGKAGGQEARNITVAP